ncbi:MAG: hypothetical protein AAB263_13015 [Planctomycetota bacterium]
MKPKHRKPARTSSHPLGYAVGSGGRIVGAAHELLVPHLLEWSKLLGGPKAMADCIRRTPVSRARSKVLNRKRRGKEPVKASEAKPGRMHPSLISKVLNASVMFPEYAATAWADDLELSPAERDAFLVVVALANAPGLILDLFDWREAVRERGAALVRATKARLKRTK